MAAFTHEKVIQQRLKEVRWVCAESSYRISIKQERVGCGRDNLFQGILSSSAEQVQIMSDLQIFKFMAEDDGETHLSTNQA